MIAKVLFRTGVALSLMACLSSCGSKETQPANITPQTTNSTPSYNCKPQSAQQVAECLISTAFASGKDVTTAVPQEIPPELKISDMNSFSRYAVTANNQNIAVAFEGDTNYEVYFFSRLKRGDEFSYVVNYEGVLKTDLKKLRDAVLPTTFKTPSTEVKSFGTRIFLTLITSTSFKGHQSLSGRTDGFTLRNGATNVYFNEANVSTQQTHALGFHFQQSN